MRCLLTLSLFFAIVVQTADAQDCVQCKSKPRISNYDLDVQVARPADTGRASLEWKQLFWFSKFARSKIFELNKNCVIFIEPLSISQGGTKSFALQENTPVLPRGDNISKFLDYLVTGSISKSEEGYVLHIQLQSACGRKQIASADVPFHATDDPDYTRQIADEAATKLSPLVDKINVFERNIRQASTDVAFANSTASLTITPKKTQLSAGEETEVEISLRDCDGFILANREVVFTKESISGFSVNATTGGTVSPSIVKTDNNGKARVKFKMGNGKTAVICAHHIFKMPTGCSAVMTGSAPIGAIPVKVEVDYEMDQGDDLTPNFSLGAVQITNGKDKTSFTRFYRSVFYHFPKTPKQYLVKAYEQDPEKWRTVYEMERGYFVFMHEREQTNADADFAGIRIHDTLGGALFELNSGTVRPTHAHVSFFMGNDLDPIGFYLEFNFENEELDHEIGTGGYPGSASVNGWDTDGKIIRNKIADPKSPYKTEYIIECSRDPNQATQEFDKANGTHFGEFLKAMNYSRSGKERLHVRILSPY
jgi:hypothetical protein